MDGRSEPPAKRRRISGDDDEMEVLAAAADVLKKPNSISKRFQSPAVRKPLEVVKNPSSSSQSSNTNSTNNAYFTVLWRKFTTKKNKTWDGDGVLSVVGGMANLQNISGREMGRIPCKGPLMVGSELKVGGKDVEIESMITKEDFLAGRPFLGSTKKPEPAQPLKAIDKVSKGSRKAQTKHDKMASTQKDILRSALPTSQASKSSFKAPLLADTVQKQQKDAPLPVPRHDPNSENALVMKRPKSVPNGRQIVDVVVDPILSAKLRPHQRAGVAFLYECVMGMKDYDGEGAVLADEMGLGKTLQTIALLWTLLKQNPIYKDAPVVKKALIVCPVTLINNWRREFHKWLGKDTLGIFVADTDKKLKLSHFTMGKTYSVMIIGYEKLRMVQEDLKKGGGIDIVIADEGHRLKTAQNKSAAAIRALNTERRVILSGTPIQNDLAEFYTMVDFVNPGLLNKYSVFKKEFETPILKSRQPGASAKELEKGEGRSAELANITGMFILRRTSEILAKYLPAKTEYVVLCRPTKAQTSVYRAIIESPTFSAALGSTSITLELINVLKKVCNSPTLLLKKDSKGEDITKPELLECIPQKLLKTPGASGKLQVLDSLLHRIRTDTEEKVVIVSNYTSTMDILANLLGSLSYTYLRLDGSTPPAKRQALVDRFNRSSASDAFVFLLSAKAGGVGLNLIGASRLVLFDIDWNPATDLQAMARVHRDGQKSPCFIYRMLTQGALDEKIFQRQVSKTGLADSIVDGKANTNGFTREELKDLFTLDEDYDGCQTHKLLGCPCGGIGSISRAEDNVLERNDLAVLDHNNDTSQNVAEPELEVICMDQDSDDEPVTRRKARWRTGNQVDWKADETDERRMAKKHTDAAGKTKMLSLMQYAHFDTSRAAPQAAGGETVAAVGNDGVEDMEETFDLDLLENAIEDDTLRSVIREDGHRVGFVFTKTSA
ncbi:helicase [Recurvomyces mirabilis]|uniref:helicase n=1 Tax=Recurvomyces mirabilis TaxID=574656 RepID=UPI002DDFAF94|nr:helicase [Recurvomyces mirabilis]